MNEAMKDHFLPSLLLWLMVQGSSAGGVAVHFDRPLETVAPFNIILYTGTDRAAPVLVAQCSDSWSKVFIG